MGRGPSIAGRKTAADAQRAKVFTRLSREIAVAARAGAADPARNSRLRMAVDKALDANMTKEAIDRAIKRGRGELGVDAMQEVRYEGYAPGGVAVLVDCMTDNGTRTVADIRHAFSRHGGHMGTAGSVAFQFAETGEIIFDIRQDPALEEKIFDVALEVGVVDVETADGFTDVLVEPTRLEDVTAALEQAGLVAIETDVVMRPASRISLDSATAFSVRRLVAWLEQLDDVQAVHHNANLTEETACQ